MSGTTTISGNISVELYSGKQTYLSSEDYFGFRVCVEGLGLENDQYYTRNKIKLKRTWKLLPSAFRIAENHINKKHEMDTGIIKRIVGMTTSLMAPASWFNHVEGHGDLVIRLMTPTTHIITLIIPMSSLVTKSPLTLNPKPYR